MSSDLRALLDRIDRLLDSYDPGPLDDDRKILEILGHRAAQRGVLEEAIRLATEGLEEFREHPQLLRRRARARTLVVTPKGEFPWIAEADADLRRLLDLDPDDVASGLDLLEVMFRFSGIPDADVAERPEDLAERAQNLLLASRALQIRALAYAGQCSRGAAVYGDWHARFPDSTRLDEAWSDVEEMGPDDKA